MSSTEQVLTEREAELLEYYRNVIDRATPIKADEDGGKLPDGFPCSDSAGEQEEQQGASRELDEQVSPAIAVADSELFETEEVER